MLDEFQFHWTRVTLVAINGNDLKHIVKVYTGYPLNVNVFLNVYFEVHKIVNLNLFSIIY